MTKKTVVSEDIKNLFVSFGGNPEAYEEGAVAQKTLSPSAKNVRKTAAQVKTAPTTVQPAAKANGILKPKPQKGGLFKPRKEQLEVALAQTASQQVLVNDDDYLLRLAGSPWLDKHLLRALSHDLAVPKAALPQVSAYESNDAHFDEQHLKLSQNQTNAQDAVVAASPVVEMSRVKSDSRVQIFVEPKPITEALKQNMINSATAGSVRKSSN